MKEKNRKLHSKLEVVAKDEVDQRNSSLSKDRLLATSKQRGKTSQLSMSQSPSRFNKINKNSIS